MKWMRFLKYHGSAVFIITPAGAGYLRLLRAVKDLPVSERFRAVVYSKLFGKKSSIKSNVSTPPNAVFGSVTRNVC